ncbi:50S ribosomal protein L21 [Candidatus Shapirobacteria bacterium]|nr:50S ribosomal protein L21 [Candidatus Shapirobacteria bacterium]
MKYTVVKIGGKQYRVTEKEEIVVAKLPQKEKEAVEFAEVLLVRDGEKLAVGQPLVKGAKVKGVILSQFKGEKIRVAKYKAKSRYRRVIGFRPLQTKVLIEKILG